MQSSSSIGVSNAAIHSRRLLRLKAHSDHGSGGVFSRWKQAVCWTFILVRLFNGNEFLNMQAEGLALAVGGKQALIGLLRQGRPVLAAHGPYTAAGESSCKSVLNLASSAACSTPMMTC